MQDDGGMPALPLMPSLKATPMRSRSLHVLPSRNFWEANEIKVELFCDASKHEGYSSKLGCRDIPFGCNRARGVQRCQICSQLQVLLSKGIARASKSHF